MPKGSCCKAKGCTSNKTDNPELSFHSFPKSKERFKIWCDLIKRPDLNHSKAITNRMSMRVCSLHFEDRMYMSPNNKSRLIWCAVPKPVTDYESSETQSTSSLGISESLDNKASVAKNIEAQEKQMGITAIQPTESTVLAQPLPLAKGSKKFDWSLALDEDVIVKEESMMDQDNHLDLSNPSSPVADSPSYRPDTKEGILKHDHSETTDDCTEYSLFLSPSGNDSSPESPCEEETNLSHRDSKYLEEMNRSIATSYQQEMNFAKPSLRDVWSPSGSSSFSASQVSSTPNVPSRLTGGTMSTRKLSSNGDEDTPTSTLLSHVKDEPIRPNETLLDTWPPIENTDRLAHIAEDTVQPTQSEKTLYMSTAVPYQPGSTPSLSCTTQLSQSHAVSVPTTATSHSDTLPLSNTAQPPQLKTEKTSMLSSSILPPQQNPTNTSEPAGTVQPFQLKTTSSPVNGTQSLQTDLLSPSISSSQSSQLNSASSSVSSTHSQSNTTVDSLLRVREPKEIQNESPTSDTVECPANGHDLTAKFSSEASVDEEPIVVDEDDVTIVDEREDAECEKDCHCSKCKEKREKLSSEGTKPVYHVHRTYSGPVKRQIVKTKGGGKRTFMILNKASLKVLQAKGLIQPLKKSTAGRPPGHIPPYKSANKELKKKYARLLNKHRQRYHLLLKKYKTLESKFAVVEDAGTPEQVIRDAKNFLSDEHVLFLESQMFLRNRPGTGNRFSKRFMRLMIEYYKRSAAGYRFLRTIFTIPSVKTVQKWLNKPLNIREEEERDPLAVPIQRSEFETADNREGNVRASGSGLRKLQNTANSEHCSEETECYSASKFPQGRSTPEESDMEEGSSEEYDSEESGLEEMDEEELHQSENSVKKIPRQNTQDSNDQEITIEWEEEPWPTVVME
ncbi:uncharacterized protein [Panulirus ornatus]|uniref:uncharacterized protein isoform X6 n=1 Tax=Panulirus ornatus TaxID=150431 RepID=UPI003A8BD570